ncbi:MAG: hypothetical protein ACK4TP_10080 [Hyphomicrobium sp.]
MTDVKHKPKGSYAVMAERRDPTDALDFFPTPPWATRALMEHVLSPDDFEGCDVHDGCAGEGHMAEVLREYFGEVHASDVRDYGMGYGVGSFTGEGADLYRLPERPDWIVMNPPFNAGVAFARKALGEARFGVALLVRNSWLESKERYELFSECPPSTVAVFSERVPMTKGRWDPEASTATSYVWVAWKRPWRRARDKADLIWIPPGQRKALTRPDDVQRFDTIISRADRIECGEVWSADDGWRTYLHTGNALLNFPADEMLRLGKRYGAHPLANDAVRELTDIMIGSAKFAKEKSALGVIGGTLPGMAVAHIPHTDRTYSKGEAA